MDKRVWVIDQAIKYVEELIRNTISSEEFVEFTQKRKFEILEELCSVHGQLDLIRLKVL